MFYIFKGQTKVYVTIDIGNLRMTHELLEGNPRTMVHAGCKADSRV